MLTGGDSPSRLLRLSGGPVTSVVHKGKTLRIFLTPEGLANTDMLLLSRASEKFALASGDQSLSEAMAAGKIVYYELAEHKQLLAQDLANMSEAIAGQKVHCLAPAEVAGFDERMCANLAVLYKAHRKYVKIMADDGCKAEIKAMCRDALLNLCYASVPNVVPDFRVIVMVKDLKGYGDIVCASKTVRFLRSQFGAAQVVLLLAGTSCLETFYKANILGVKGDEAHHDYEDLAANGVYVLGLKGKPCDAETVLGGSLKGAARCLLLSVPSMWNTTELRKLDPVLAGIPCDTFIFEEYAYTVYDSNTKALHGKMRNEKNASLGIAPYELGVLLEDSLRTFALQPDPASALAELYERAGRQTLAKALFEDCPPQEYPRRRRLYFGYGYKYNMSRYNFLRVIANLEAANEHHLDVVIAGKPTGAAFDPQCCIRELANLGIDRVLVYAVPANDSPIVPFGDGVYEIPAVRPDGPRAPLPVKEITIRNFLGCLNPHSNVFSSRREDREKSGGNLVARSDLPMSPEQCETVAAMLADPDKHLEHAFVELENLVASVGRWEQKLLGFIKRLVLRRARAADCHDAEDKLGLISDPSAEKIKACIDALRKLG